MDMVGVGLTICGITVPTGGVIIAALFKRGNSNSNPGNGVSEKVCDAKMEGLETSIRNFHHRVDELDKNLGGKIGSLETSINNLIAKK